MDQAERLKELFQRYLRRDLSPAGVEELVSLLDRADAEDILSEPMRVVWEELKARQAEHSVDWERMYREISQADARLIRPGGKTGGLRESGRGGSKGAGALGRSRLGRAGGLGRVRMERAGALGRRHLARAIGLGRHGSGRTWDVWGWRALAAVFLGLAGLAAYWSVIYRGPKALQAVAASQGKTATKETPAVFPADSAFSWTTVKNKKVIHLPDGSMVILNRHSRLAYTGREVTLDGEAYFDIVHRPEHPFLVRAGKITTRVLGTAFDVRAYATDHSIEVTVDHGKVQVLKSGTNLGLLSDREQLRFDTKTDNFHSLRVNLKLVMAWKPEEISFDDITMEEAAKRLERQFHVVFRFENPALKDCRITATFYIEDDLDQIMTVICGVNQSSYQIKGGVVTIDGKGCN